MENAKSNYVQPERWDFEAMRRIFGLDPRSMNGTQDYTFDVSFDGTPVIPPVQSQPTTPVDASKGTQDTFDELAQRWDEYQKRQQEEWRKRVYGDLTTSEDEEGDFSTKCFMHDWQDYVGFTEVYRFCRVCDAKEYK